MREIHKGPSMYLRKDMKGIKERYNEMKSSQACTQKGRNRWGRKNVPKNKRADPDQCDKKNCQMSTKVAKKLFQ